MFVVPAELLGTCAVISPFFNIPPPDGKEDMNTGFAYDGFKERVVFVDGVVSFAGILKQLLDQGRIFHMTNPLDAVYAVFGLAEHLQDLYKVKRGRGVVAADYRVSVRVLYRFVAKYILTSTYSLSLLSFWPDLTVHEIEGLPSWVPDFSIVEGGVVHAHDPERKFNAANIKHRPAQIRRIEEDQLTIRGNRLDVICRRGELSEDAAVDVKVMESLLEICLEMPLTCDNGHDRVEAMFRTLDWGINFGADPLSSEDTENFGLFILGNLQYRVYRAVAFEEYSDWSCRGSF
jgi:hypothetical protein